MDSKAELGIHKSPSVSIKDSPCMINSFIMQFACLHLSINIVVDLYVYTSGIFLSLHHRNCMCKTTATWFMGTFHCNFVILCTIYDTSHIVQSIYFKDCRKWLFLVAYSIYIVKQYVYHHCPKKHNCNNVKIMVRPTVTFQYFWTSNKTFHFILNVSPFEIKLGHNYLPLICLRASNFEDLMYAA